MSYSPEKSVEAVYRIRKAKSIYLFISASHSVSSCWRSIYWFFNFSIQTCEAFFMYLIAIVDDRRLPARFDL